MERIQSDLKIDIKDQVLLTKTGMKLSADHILERLE
jgi:hypothetical protein